MAGRISTIFRLAALASMTAIAACSSTPEPAPPPPPPPEPEAFPARPLAPNRAHEGLQVPRTDPTGVRQTVNTWVTPAQAVWNLRSAYNVAALNCDGVIYEPMAERYGAFLGTHTRDLAAAGRTVDSEFRQKYGPSFRDPQDAYMTQVYNYFALPAMEDEFCPIALAVSEELASMPKGGLSEAAPGLLLRLEEPFLAFFERYEAYKEDAAAWEAQYLATYGEPYPYTPRSFAPAPSIAPVAVDANGNPVDPAPSNAGVPAPGATVVTDPVNAIPPVLQPQIVPAPPAQEAPVAPGATTPVTTTGQ